MKRKYFHAEVHFENGKFVCASCGSEVDEYLTSDAPCTEQTTALTVIDSLPLFISVYNCAARLAAQIPNSDGSFSVVTFEPSDEIADEFYEMIEDDIYKQGGALNLSGWYSLSDRTARQLAKWLKAGKVRVQR